MTFDEWWEQRDPFMPFLMDDFEDWPSEWKVMKLAFEAYDAGFKEACRRYNLREDPFQGFDEYSYYGENNPPVGELK